MKENESHFIHKKLGRIGSLGMSAVLVTGCAAATPPSDSQPPNDNHTVTWQHSYITRINESNNLFLVTRVDGSYYIPDIVTLGEGERYMVSHGCEISDIKRVSSGDLVTVGNPETCLPETK